MRIKPLLFGLIVLGLFGGIIGGGMASGYWVTKQSLPSAGTVQSSADLKGWMTITQVSETLQLPIPTVLEKLRLPASTDPSKSLKTLATEQQTTPDELKARLFE
ncbi:hypothetical protein [Heliophilum fasciatum]|uniref:Uncharacterized protein n=1 Tax=Heliophilum fasciatum TaxID=35700 RepID=A0A4R2RA92_9FIRM|nr:hypothetical protein [Heliophilum fasciatum]MCW2279378.1 hypothetical protein [Heliophilum fasciatum]TCP60190.1 hypothetical protein EDD73_1415 [Heliophilum fasciatum]